MSQPVEPTPSNAVPAESTKIESTSANATPNGAASVMDYSSEAPAINAAAYARKRSLAAFIVVVTILLLAGVTLQAAVSKIGLYFRKQPVELRKQLTELPTRLGPWLQVSKDQPIEHGIEDVLGTKQYIFRDYIRVGSGPDDVSESEAKEFDGLSTEEQRRKLSEVMRSKPRAVLNVAVTYYTGMVDTVAHVPDRCYVADGFEPTNPEKLEWPVWSNRLDGTRNLAVRFITFEDQNAARQAETRNVGYFFNANGQYEADPLSVRFLLQDLRQRYGYYAKVEMMNALGDRNASSSAMADFLVHAMPELEQCLPDWNAVIQKK